MSFSRNPVGRTGVCGRGRLARWGPNHAADPIVTRYLSLECVISLNICEPNIHATCDKRSVMCEKVNCVPTVTEYKVSCHEQ